MAHYGDHIYSTLHNKVMPCPSTVKGESGALRSHWNGKDNVLDSIKRGNEDELKVLLDFDKRRTNKYNNFSG